MKKGARKPFCIRGHDLTDPNNVYESWNGQRHCVICNFLRNTRQGKLDAEKRREERKARGELEPQIKPEPDFSHLFPD